MFIVDSAFKFGTVVLELAKKMTLEHWIILLLVLGFAGIGYAANNYYDDYKKTKRDFANYKIEVNIEKYEERLVQLDKEKAVLEVKLKRAVANGIMHEEAAKRFLTEWTKLSKNRPKKDIIKNKMEKLDGKKSICDEFIKYDVECFNNISSH